MPIPRYLRRPLPRRWTIAVGLALVVLALPASVAPARTSVAGTSGVVAMVNSCGTASGPTPAALIIPAKNPTVTLSSGDKMTVTYEFMVRGYTSAVLGESVHIPSVFASFPLSNGTSFSFFLVHRNVTIQNGTWTAPSVATDVKTIHATWTFANPGNATLSTQKLAVMASNSAYGNVTLEFRWMWSIDQTANGHGTTIGPWTVPSTHLFPPSIFEPAPLVNLISHNGPTIVIGFNWVGNLTGAISSTSFLVEIEYPSGTPFSTDTEPTPPGNSTPFRAHTLMMSNDNTLSPTKALVHIHDHCGAILYSISVVAVYGTSALIHVDVAPASCGPVTFNGTAYANRSTVSLVPGPSGYPISVAACSGHAFLGWQGNLGVDADPVFKLSSSVVVSAGGTLTAKFL
jgi:hypothetical protein